MITQGIMDMFASFLSQLLVLIPPLPAEWTDAVTTVTGGGAYFGSKVAKLGVIIPWQTFWTVLQWWIAAVQFWVVMLGLRAILWLVGR